MTSPPPQPISKVFLPNQTAGHRASMLPILLWACLFFFATISSFAQTARYQYDADSRLIAAVYPTYSLVYEYDGNGNLIRQSKLSLDQDGDGLPDWWEFSNHLSWTNDTGLDSLNGDKDGDGLTNAEELAHGTRADLWDTDGDNASDAYELAHGSNPLDAGSIPLRYLQVTAAAYGAVNQVSGYYTNLSLVSLAATPVVYYHFLNWLGDVPADATASNPVIVCMDSNRAITAVFVENLATNGTPEWWLAQFGWTNNFDANALDDQDGDGLLTWQEYPLGLNPTVADSDRDGLSDGQEVALGTNPLDPDSDGDNVTDGREVQDGTNPTNAASCNITFTAASPYGVNGGGGFVTSPALSGFGTIGQGCPVGLNANSRAWNLSGIIPALLLSERDSDQDGILDDDEIEIFHTDPLACDTDGDGMSDLDELIAGTSPIDPLDVLRAFVETPPSNGAPVVIWWNTVTNRVYDLLATPDFIGSWTNVLQAAPGNGAPISYTNEDAAAEQRYFRIRVTKP